MVGNGHPGPSPRQAVTRLLDDSCPPPARFALRRRFVLLLQESVAAGLEAAKGLLHDMEALLEVELRAIGRGRLETHLPHLVVAGLATRQAEQCGSEHFVESEENARKFRFA